MKLCANLSLCSSKMDQLEMVPHLAKAGFDGCFWTAKNEDYANIHPVAKSIRENGLYFQSVHAPFGQIQKIWEETDEGTAVLSDLIQWVRTIAGVQVDILVCHVWKGFVECHPTAIGIDRFGELLLEAEKEGVRIAFENTEGENMLEALRDAHWGSPAAGFCIDTGHEICYNTPHDMIRKYGDKLIATHLNDNLGKTGQEITWLDDAHLFPFDGVADWNGIADRLKKANFTEVLTFELSILNKPGRNTHDRYADMTVPEILREAYEKAVKFANLMK